MLHMEMHLFLTNWRPLNLLTRNNFVFKYSITNLNFGYPPVLCWTCWKAVLYQHWSIAQEQVVKKDLFRIRGLFSFVLSSTNAVFIFLTVCSIWSLWSYLAYFRSDSGDQGTMLFWAEGVTHTSVRDTIQPECRMCAWQFRMCLIDHLLMSSVAFFFQLPMACDISLQVGIFDHIISCRVCNR